VSGRQVLLGPLAALAARYDRMAAVGAAPVPGFAPAQIGFVLVLDEAGKVVTVQDERTVVGKAVRPRIVEAPQPPKRTVAVVSGLLWDKTSYVLGVTAIDPEADGERAAKAQARTAKEHEAFKVRQAALLDPVDDPGARALLAFLECWTPATYETLAYQDEMLDQNVAFRLFGDHGYLHERPALRAAVAAQAAAADAEIGQCLVTGLDAPIARLHPAIKGVPGAQSSGASLVSFNAAAFTSFGKTQGDNAPTSELAAFGYGTALNDLLSAQDGIDANGRPRYRNRVQIGDATTVFWVDAEDPKLVQEAEALASQLFGGPTTDELAAGKMARARPLMRDLEAGLPLQDIAGQLADLRLYVLGLSPNAARLSVRFWHVGSLGEMAGHFQAHWRDLRLAGSRFADTPAPLWRLLRQVAAQGEAKNIPANLSGEVTRAILTGARYPQTLLSQALMRVRADQGADKLHDLRVALIKAVIVRGLRKDADALMPPTPLPEEKLVSLDLNEPDAGYRLGRLFAVMEAAQAQAIKGVNASIRDRFYGSASATPAHVFPLLLRGVQDHLSKIRKTAPGLAVKYEKAIAEVMDGMGARLPATLDMHSQGLFAIGYYHQRTALYARRVEGEAELETALTAPPEETDDQ
jgi:CRISPR-associated protein Csd1